MSDKNFVRIKYTTWLINKNDIPAQCNSLDSRSLIKRNSKICLMQWSKTYKQTNNKYKWLFFSITRHSLYWESPQFSLFVSYYGPLTWPHLPKTHFPISAQETYISLPSRNVQKIVWNRQLLYSCNYLVVSIHVQIHSYI